MMRWAGHVVGMGRRRRPKIIRIHEDFGGKFLLRR
jgi:hypothetical protein